MSTHLRRDADRVRDRIDHGDPFWPVQLAIAVAIGLNFVLSDKVTIGPTWAMPAIEGVLLLALVVLLPRRATAHSMLRRQLVLALILVVSLAYVGSLALLVHYLIDGGRVGGHRLLLSGAALWATNVLIFAVGYWELDRGGPVVRFLEPDTLPDLSYPQMQNPELAPKGWRPGFLDYVYTSFTNSTAFSPTDTMPLTQVAKVTMGVQSLCSLLTVGLVIARAVNILA